MNYSKLPACKPVRKWRGLLKMLKRWSKWDDIYLKKTKQKKNKTKQNKDEIQLKALPGKTGKQY